MPNQNVQLHELEYVERPFLKQLHDLGWEIIEGDKYEPEKSMRENFQDVIIKNELETALKNINDWLEDDQINQIVRRLEQPGSNNLLHANKEILEDFILENSIIIENRKENNKGTPVTLIDFKNPDKNRFLAITQFKVNIPGTEDHIIPDIVLFINGLPLVLVECKSSHISQPIEEAITQLKRYSCQRGSTSEGNEKLFWYNQLMIATCRQKAMYSTITGDFEHYLEWKDPYPHTLSDIETGDSESITSQNLLIQGMLTKEKLLDIIHSFTIFIEEKGRIIKLAPRYQQYRTVLKIIDRLKSNIPNEEKKGTVWHTQGSGKSLTMMYAVRRMYHEPELTGYKVIFITDRKDLQKQLSDTIRGAGYTVKPAGNIRELQNLISTDTPDLIMAMIQKFRPNEIRATRFPANLNTSEKILVMTDEAHRTEFGILRANLRSALPNKIDIAFTGTPIDRMMTEFGDYIDEYTIEEAVKDGVTVKIVYEGRAHEAEITDNDAMNQKFLDVFDKGISEDTRNDILGRYTWKGYLEADETIKAKCRDMLNHYLTQVFPNGFKAQVVATSRIAAIKYKQQFDTAIKEARVYYTENPDPKINNEWLNELEVQVIISGSANDEPWMQDYTNENQTENYIDRFKMEFGEDKEGVRGNIGILIVNWMLLTGFDAPVEQVMYLDNVIREHNLLQAIARVNRVKKNKTAGFIIDYTGITKHLKESLSNFNEDDVNRMLSVVQNYKEDIEELKLVHSEIVNFFQKYDIDDYHDVDVCVDLLVDDETRDEFTKLFNTFSSAMDRVLPRTEALDYVEDLKIFSWISETARQRYRDNKLSIRDASKKIRAIINEYLVSHGVDPKIPPFEIFSQEFRNSLNEIGSDKSKALALEYAIRDHIEKKIDRDPELYEYLAEKLEKLLEEYRNNWEKLALELQAIIEEARKGRADQETYGLDPESEAPFMGLLKKEVFQVRELSELSNDDREKLISVTKDILNTIKRELQIPEFWSKPLAQRRLRRYIASHILSSFHGRQINRFKIAQLLLELSWHLEKELVE